MATHETASGESAIAVEGTATGPHTAGVRGSGEGAGVVGKCKTGWGVNGESDTGLGVRGVSNTGWGVNGESGPGVGVRGVSNTGWGVDGESESGIGVRGIVNEGDGVAVHGVKRGNGGFAGVFEGNVKVTANLGVAGDIVLANADCAEDFDVVASETVAPGTVMVLTEDGSLRASEMEYDRRVAGVVSGAGNYRPGLVLDRQMSRGGRLPIALLGKVYCQVDASKHPVHVGDLLTTSSLAGHAMKAIDPLRAFGAVIGKAIGGLESGTGLLPVLVALQ